MPTVAEQQAAAQRLIDGGFPRDLAYLAAGNEQFPGNPLLARLAWAENFRSGYEGYAPLSLTNAQVDFGLLPALVSNATEADRRFYGQFQNYYNQLLQATPDAETGNPDSGFFGPIDREPFAAFEIESRMGGLEGLSQYNDPNVREYVRQLIHNATLTDRFSFLGDNLFPALALFGVAVGGAALAGAGAGASGGAIGAGAGASALPAEFVAPAVLSSGATPAAGFAVGEGVLAGAGGAGAALAPSVLSSGTTPAAGVAFGEGSAAALPAGFTAPAVASAGTTASGGTTVASSGGGSLLPTSFADYARLGTTLYGVGTGLYDRFGGGGSEAENLASLQGDIARQLFTETTPLRGQSLAQLLQYLQTGVLPPALLQGLDKAYATGRTGLEDQYSVARENILGRVPSRGGQLNSQLANLEQQRATQVGRLGSDLLTQYELPLRNTLFASATGLPFGQAGQALGNIGQSAGTLGQIEARNAQVQFQQEQAIGSLLASLFTPQTAPAGTSLQPSLLERLFG